MLQRFRTVMTDLPRSWKRGIMVAYDIVAVAVALWFSYSLRYGIWMPPHTRDQWAGLAVAPLIAIPVFARMGLYRTVVRYISEQALWTMIRATTYAAIGLVIVAFVTAAATRGAAPRSVPLLFWALASIFVIGGRFVAKAVLGPPPANRLKSRSIAVYGAGEAGAHLVASIRAQRGRAVTAFIDEDPSLWGHEVAGVRVRNGSGVAAATGYRTGQGRRG